MVCTIFFSPNNRKTTGNFFLLLPFLALSLKDLFKAPVMPLLGGIAVAVMSVSPVKSVLTNHHKHKLTGEEKGREE